MPSVHIEFPITTDGDVFVSLLVGVTAELDDGDGEWRPAVVTWRKCRLLACWFKVDLPFESTENKCEDIYAAEVLKLLEQRLRNEPSLNEVFQSRCEERWQHDCERRNELEFEE